MRLPEWLGAELGIPDLCSLLVMAAFLFLAVCITKLPKKTYDFTARVMIGTAAGILLGLTGHYVLRLTEDSAPWINFLSFVYPLLFQLLLLPVIWIATVYRVLHIGNSSWEEGKKRRYVIFGMLAAAVVVGVIFGAFHQYFTGNDSIFFKEREFFLRNSFTALGVSGNLLTAFFFAYLTGASAKRMTVKYMETVKPFLNFTDACYMVMTSILKTIIGYKPIGALAIMTAFTLGGGVEFLWELFLFLVFLYLACAVMFLIQVVCAGFCGINPAVFLKAAMPAIKLAVKTGSGAACLDTVKEILKKDFHRQSEETALAAEQTIRFGMQGCEALFPAMAAVYVIGGAGGMVSVGTVILVAAASLAVSYGITGMPGTATLSEFGVTMGSGFGSLAANLGPLMAVDPIADTPRTVINVTGSLANAILAERRNKK